SLVRGVSMKRWVAPFGLLFVALATTVAQAAPPDDLPKNLHTIRAVAAEGDGNKEAGVAWRAPVKSRAPDPPQILAAFDEANPLAVNYLRSAVETIAQRELDNGGKLPADDLEKFIGDTKHDPRARRLAYELLAGVDPTAADRIIPGLLNDPSVEFRRDAVARLLEQAPKQLATGDKDAARKLLVEALSEARDEDQVKAVK